MICPSIRRGADATGRSPRGDGGSRGPSLRRGSGSGASPRRSWSPAFPAPQLAARCRTGRDRAAGETHVYRSTRAVLWFCFVLVGVFWLGLVFWFGFGVFFEHQQHEEEEESHPASSLICNHKLRDMVGLSDGMSPPWAARAAVGVLPPPFDLQQGQAGCRGPRSPNASRHCSILLSAHKCGLSQFGEQEGTGALSSLPLNFLV